MAPKLVHIFAVILAATTFLMVSAGGLVTTMDAGDSVPDWPLSYGSVLPKMTGGILYEHSHRMIGWLVGFLSLGLALLLWKTESRPWVRRFGLLALLAIFSQGALGGMRVLIVSNPELQDALRGSNEILDVSSWRQGIAMVHAVSGQLIFSLMVILAWVTSASWSKITKESGPLESVKLRRLALMTTGWIFLQIVLGVILRHTGTALAFHIGVAVLVLVHVAALMTRTQGAGSALGRLGSRLAILVFLQVLMGLGAWAGLQNAGPPSPGWEAFVRTGHVALGALVLAGSLVLALEIYMRTEIPSQKRLSS